MEFVYFAAAWFKAVFGYECIGLDDSYVYRFQDLAWRFFIARD